MDHPDGGERLDGIEATLVPPDRDGGIESRDIHQEVELHELLEAQTVMERSGDGGKTQAADLVIEELRHELLAIGECDLRRQHLFRLLDVGAARGGA